MKSSIIKKHIMIIAAGTLYFLMCRFLNITCPIKAIIGINCPTCGMTRAILSLLHGNFDMYFKYNPFALPCAISAFLLIHKRAFHTNKACDIVAVSVLLMNFVYYIFNLLNTQKLCGLSPCFFFFNNSTYSRFLPKYFSLRAAHKFSSIKILIFLDKCKNICYNIFMFCIKCGYGGIGRRARFRFQWQQYCAGSSPVIRTKRYKSEPCTNR